VENILQVSQTAVTRFIVIIRFAATQTDPQVMKASRQLSISMCI
jgi:hypothetical protein